MEEEYPQDIKLMRDIEHDTKTFRRVIKNRLEHEILLGEEREALYDATFRVYKIACWYIECVRETSEMRKQRWYQNALNKLSSATSSLASLLETWDEE